MEKSTLEMKICIHKESAQREQLLVDLLRIYYDTIILFLPVDNAQI